MSLNIVLFSKVKPHLWYWVWIAETYFSFVVPTFHVVTMMPLMAKSTGMIWAKSSALQCMLRITPLPPPTSSPMGPFRLSTHPATGSFTDGVTAITFHISSACRGSRPCRRLPAARWVRWGCPPCYGLICWRGHCNSSHRCPPPQPPLQKIWLDWVLKIRFEGICRLTNTKNISL